MARAGDCAGAPFPWAGDRRTSPTGDDGGDGDWRLPSWDGCDDAACDSAAGTDVAGVAAAVAGGDGDRGAAGANSSAVADADWEWWPNCWIWEEPRRAPEAQGALVAVTRSRDR